MKRLLTLILGESATGEVVIGPTTHHTTVPVTYNLNGYNDWMQNVYQTNNEIYLQQRKEQRLLKCQKQ